MFKKKVEEFFTNLGNSKKMVFATSFENRVTARMMSVIIYDNKFYLQTDKNFLKYYQLVNNPQVALCFDNVQIEGIAKVIGQPKETQFFLALFSKAFKNSYETYSFLENERLIEITPTFITVWNYKEKQAIRENFHFNNNEYSETIYIGS